MSVQFLTTPPVGTLMLLDHQRYELMAVDPFVRKDGTPSKLLRWRAPCFDCGEIFEAVSGMKDVRPARRCQAHRVSGKATGKPFARVTVKIIEPESAG